MQHKKPSPLAQILGVPAEIVVGLYVILDALVSPLFRPVVRWLSTLRVMKRIEHWIGSMHPYVILVLLVVPFGIAELAKVLGVYLMGTGHFHSGLTIFLGAYVVSILVCERTFHAGKAQLMTIGWFAVAFNWIMSIKDAILGWFRQTRVWALAADLRQKARLLTRRIKTRVAALFGFKPTGEAPSSFAARPKRVLDRH